MADPKKKTVFCVGTADTKSDELRFLAASLRSHLHRQRHLFSPQVTVVDVSVGPLAPQAFGDDFPFVARRDLLGSSDLLPDDRGEAIALMAAALERLVKRAFDDGGLCGVIGIGGSGGTALAAPAFRSLPIGVPKLIVSTVASGQTEPYVATSDLVLFPSVVDVAGLNSVSRALLSNAAAAFAGMVVGRGLASDGHRRSSGRGTVGLTMFGVTTPCVNAVKERLEEEGFETLVFHATGVGGRAMEDLVKGGFIQV